MKLNKRLSTLLLAAGLLIGGLVAGIVFTNNPGTAVAAPSAQTAADCVDDDSMETAETPDSDMDEVECDHEEGEADEANEANETDEADDVAPAGLGISADEARAIAQEAYPDAAVLEIEFDREGGKDIFEAELDNGTDVKIDANTGEILGTDIRDAD